jgi:hypothetical protein
MWVDRETGRPTMAGSSGAIFEAFLEGYLPQQSVAMDGADEIGAESVDPAAGEESLF